MEFRLLGPVELWCASQDYDLGSLKAKCVLAILLLNVGIVVPADTLIGRVWDASPPHKAREALSAYITRLRRVMEQIPCEQARLSSRAQGYSLQVDPETVDLYRFRRLRRQARMAAEAGGASQATQLLREADSLWRGEALAGLPGDAMTRMRRSLGEERRAAIIERAQIELSLSLHSDLVGEFQRLLDQNPADEEFAALHMTALYRSGRPAEALNVYREIRERLIEEQGTEPGPTLAELQQRILRRDPGLSLPSVQPAENTQPSGHLPVPDTLPPTPKEFVGRTEEISRLNADSDSPAVRLIIGMPGIGKTALAVKIAHTAREAFPGGRLFVSFNTHDLRNPPLDASGALLELLRMLDVPTDVIPPTLGARSALWHAETARRRLIVVLDDVAESEQVLAFLPTTPGCRILITSRNRFSDLDEAVPLVLGSLPADDGARLFARVAGLPGDDQQGTIAEVVRRCGGHPLAIQLVARGLREGHPSTLSELLTELAQPTLTLTSDAGRQVAAAFDLSYRSLSAQEQMFFRHLALHPGTDITVPAAAALTATINSHAQTALTALTDRHLLEKSSGIFRFHDLTRDFASACATREDREDDRRRALDQLIGHYEVMANSAEETLYPGSHRDPQPATHVSTADPAVDTAHKAADWLELEWRNVLHTARHAYAHERKPQCVNLTRALARWLDTAGHWGEAVRAHELALRACRELDDLPGVARTSMELSLLANKTGHNTEALRHAETAAGIYKSIGDHPGQADALDQIGTIHQSSGRFREALAYHQEASELYRAEADVAGLATALNRCGIACSELGRYQIGIDHFQAALALYRQVDDLRGEARTLNNLGRVYRNQGYHRDSLKSYYRALEIFQSLGGEQNQAILYQNIGAIHHYKGNFEEALSSYRAALKIYRKIGDLPGEADTLNDIGETLIATEDYEAALDHHRRAEATSWELGASHERVIALRGMAEAYRGTGRYDQALDYYGRALRLARENSEPYEEGKILAGIAEATLQTQGLGAARIYWHQAYDAFRELDVPEAEAVSLRLTALSAAHDAQTPSRPFRGIPNAQTPAPTQETEQG